MIIYILKILDFIKMLNCLFVRDVLTKTTILPFQNYFNKSENLYQHNTRYAKQNCHTGLVQYIFQKFS